MMPVNEARRNPDRAELGRRIIEEALGLGPEVTQEVRDSRKSWRQEPRVQGRRGARGCRQGVMDDLRQQVENESRNQDRD